MQDLIGKLDKLYKINMGAIGNMQKNDNMIKTVLRVILELAWRIYLHEILFVLIFCIE